MPMIHLGDPDFRVCQISFDTLVDLQAEAETNGFGTRWTSVDALRNQVKEAPLVLQSLMREERSGAVRSYRCLVLFEVAGDGGGAIAAIDIAPTTFHLLDRLDRDADVRSAFARIFSIALGGISTITKG